MLRCTRYNLTWWRLLTTSVQTVLFPSLFPQIRTDIRYTAKYTFWKGELYRNNYNKQFVHCYIFRIIMSCYRMEIFIVLFDINSVPLSSKFVYLPKVVNLTIQASRKYFIIKIITDPPSSYWHYKEDFCSHLLADNTLRINVKHNI